MTTPSFAFAYNLLVSGLGSFDGKLGSFDSRLRSFDSRLRSFDGRQGSLVSRLRSFDGRLGSLVSKPAGFVGKVTDLVDRYHSLAIEPPNLAGMDMDFAQLSGHRPDLHKISPPPFSKKMGEDGRGCYCGLYCGYVCQISFKIILASASSHPLPKLTVFAP